MLKKIIKTLFNNTKINGITLIQKKMHVLDSTEAPRALVDFAIAPSGSAPGAGEVTNSHYAHNQSEHSMQPFWVILGLFTGFHVTTVVPNS